MVVAERKKYMFREMQKVILFPESFVQKCQA